MPREIREFEAAWSRYAAASVAYYNPNTGDITDEVGEEFHAAQDAMMLTRAGNEDDLWRKWGVLDENLPEAVRGGGLRGSREMVWLAAIKADVVTLGIGSR